MIPSDRANWGYKGSIRQLRLCPKAKEAAAALLPDVAATSDGFHDVFGDPASCRLVANCRLVLEGGI